MIKGIANCLLSSNGSWSKVEIASLYLYWSRGLGCVSIKDGDSGLRSFVVVEPELRHLLASSRHQLPEMSRGVCAPGLNLVGQVSIGIEDRDASAVFAISMGIAHKQKRLRLSFRVHRDDRLEYPRRLWSNARQCCMELTYVVRNVC